jgi:Ni,Fe-hydrogenase I cytochrome b subunit
MVFVDRWFFDQNRWFLWIDVFLIKKYMFYDQKTIYAKKHLIKKPSVQRPYLFLTILVIFIVICGIFDQHGQEQIWSLNH